MTKYLVKFNVMQGKIPMIKLMRSLTEMGLKESKDFIEAKFEEFEEEKIIDVTVTEQQLGKHLIRNLLYPTNSFTLITAKVVEENNVIDLT